MKNANGYGAVIKMSGNRRKPYAVRVTVGFVNGVQKYKYLGYYEKRNDALIALAEYNKNPYELDVVKLTFADVYKRYMDCTTFGVGSLKARKTAYNHCAAIHNTIFREIRTAHMQAIINGVDSISSQRLLGVLFHKVFEFAMINDIVTKDYSAGIILPKKKKPAQKTIFTNDEVNILWKNRGNVNADILLILLYSGMRINELLTLRKEQIKLKESHIIGGLKTVAGIDRYIPIHDKIKPIFEEYINANETPFLFLGKTNKPIRYDSYQRKRFAPLMRKLNMNHTIHETRHTAITAMHNAGGNQLAIKRIVGHAGETTDIYTHLEKSVLHETINLINY